MATVLICDDAVAFSILFRRWMRDQGIDDVISAGTREEAVALAREHRPDVIVLDHLLGTATSDVLIPQLRAVAPEARILLISGMPDDHLGRAAEEACADAHLGKAASRDEMRAAVLALLA